jgi:CO/xanthine dehydrogenase Mo-binding subunit
MTRRAPATAAGVPRREFLKAGGALVVGFSFAEPLRAQQQAEWVAFAPGPALPDPNQLDTWIAVHPDNTATIFLGFVELGQGNSTALLQIAAEELDLDMAQVRTVRVETGTSPNQGGTVASASISRGGPRIRLAAAEARQALLRMASTRLGVAADRLTVEHGVVSVRGDAARSVAYGALIGNRRFDVPYTGTAPVKDHRTHTIVGTSVPRHDIPEKARGEYAYVQHVRLPGMLHGRVVRPRGQGAYADVARVTRVDAGSIRGIPAARVLRRRDFVGVVAPREWDAVRAARQLRVAWDVPSSLPATPAALFQRMRAAKTVDRVVLDRGDVAAALARARHVVSRRYDAPYQMHAPFAPNCAVADVRADAAVIMCSTQNVYETRAKVADVLHMPADKVTVRYYEGSGTFGHSCYDDAAQAAAVMSQEAGTPVRVQFMRWDEHGWDNYGPAHTADVTIAADAEGKLLAYEYHGWQHAWSLTETSAQLAAGQPPTESPGQGQAQGVSPPNTGAMYAIPSLRLVNHRVPGIDGFLKGSYLRSPLDIAISFGAEQTLDELAYLVGLDPYLFRRQNMADDRWLAVLNAVAEAARWSPRRAAAVRSGARVATGRGIAVGTHLTSYAAAVAEIEVDTQTGRITAKRMFGAIDAGQAVNPGFIENQIGGMLVQAASRVLKEEVTFSRTGVTSLDWMSYPVLRCAESPEVTAIVVTRQDQPSTGAGEEVLGPAAAAIANALFDATGVRLREHPMTPARVLAAIQGK